MSKVESETKRGKSPKMNWYECMQTPDDELVLNWQKTVPRPSTQNRWWALLIKKFASLIR